MQNQTNSHYLHLLLFHWPQIWMTYSRNRQLIKIRQISISVKMVPIQIKWLIRKLVLRRLSQSKSLRKRLLSLPHWWSQSKALLEIHWNSWSWIPKRLRPQKKRKHYTIYKNSLRSVVSMIHQVKPMKKRIPKGSEWKIGRNTRRSCFD